MWRRGRRWRRWWARWWQYAPDHAAVVGRLHVRPAEIGFEQALAVTAGLGARDKRRALGVGNACRAALIRGGCLRRRTAKNRVVYKSGSMAKRVGGQGTYRLSRLCKHAVVTQWWWSHMHLELAVGIATNRHAPSHSCIARVVVDQLGHNRRRTLQCGDDPARSHCDEETPPATTGHGACTHGLLAAVLSCPVLSCPACPDYVCGFSVENGHFLCDDFCVISGCIFVNNFITFPVKRLLLT